MLHAVAVVAEDMVEAAVAADLTEQTVTTIIDYLDIV
jgi:hypothetical protein